MSLTTIVSYDGTAGDRDALSLARVFAGLGADTILAYVKHSNTDHATEQGKLDAGAADLAGAQTRIVVNASTSEGLKALAAAEHANLIVFGSEYRTPAGRVAFQKSASQLLDGGATAVAIAPAGYVERPIKTIGLLAELDDHAAIDTAHAIATHFGATVSDSHHGADLLIVGSRAAAGEGRVLMSSRNEITIEEEAKTPVLVVARGVALNFRAPLTVVA
jgi:nucleotide-binding universal stress UspA family protein